MGSEATRVSNVHLNWSWNMIDPCAAACKIESTYPLLFERKGEDSHSRGWPSQKWSDLVKVGQSWIKLSGSSDQNGRCNSVLGGLQPPPPSSPAPKFQVDLRTTFHRVYTISHCAATSLQMMKSSKDSSNICSIINIAMIDMLVFILHCWSRKNPRQSSTTNVYVLWTYSEFHSDGSFQSPVCSLIPACLGETYYPDNEYLNKLQDMKQSQICHQIQLKIRYRVFFLTGAPPKNSKYKKVTLG